MTVGKFIDDYVVGKGRKKKQKEERAKSYEKEHDDDTEIGYLAQVLILIQSELEPNGVKYSKLRKFLFCFLVRPFRPGAGARAGCGPAGLHSVGRWSCGDECLVRAAEHGQPGPYGPEGQCARAGDGLEGAEIISG